MDGRSLSIMYHSQQRQHCALRNKNKQTIIEIYLWYFVLLYRGGPRGYCQFFLSIFDAWKHAIINTSSIKFEIKQSVTSESYIELTDIGEYGSVFPVNSVIRY